ncbi:tetratricopeptide repeat protein, partial [Klebsiella pneumoniae]|uniref:tetratricopeptide repeat protein n=1 Tax=Klebsiella pneumoniae TaxID=573 RepID=UPI00272F678E
EKALEEDPDHLLTLIALADYYNNLQNSSECLKYAQKALEVDFKQTEAHMYAAMSYMKLGDVESALDHASLAVKYDPSLASAHFILGLIY